MTSRLAVQSTRPRLLPRALAVWQGALRHRGVADALTRETLHIRRSGARMQQYRWWGASRLRARFRARSRAYSSLACRPAVTFQTPSSLTMPIVSSRALPVVGLRPSALTTAVLSLTLSVATYVAPGSYHA